MQHIKGYRLSEDLRSFLSDLKNLQQMVALLPQEQSNPLTSSAIENFLIIINKDAQHEATPGPIQAILRATVEAGGSTLRIEDAIALLETLPLLYEVADAVRPPKELVVVAVQALEAIAFNNSAIDYFSITFVWLCKSDLHSIALQALDAQPPKTWTDTYWANRATLLLKLGSVKDALKCFDEALRLRVHPLYYVNKARAYDLLAQFHESLALLDKATALIQDGWFEQNNIGATEKLTVLYMVCVNHRLDYRLGIPQPTRSLLHAVPPSSRFRPG